MCHLEGTIFNLFREALLMIVFIFEINVLGNMTVLNLKGNTTALVYCNQIIFNNYKLFGK